MIDDGDSPFWGVFAERDGQAVCYLTDPPMLAPLRPGEDEANARLIAAAPVGLETAEATYLALLQMPHDAERFRLQRTLCALRDFIALATGRESEDVQNEFEVRATRERLIR